jgi:hypothetical protein
MFMRIVGTALAVATTIAVAGIGLSSQAAAARRSGDGGGGTSRSCLTGAAQSLLNRIESQFGTMRIVSTCRPGATIAGSGKVSRHASGNAIDFEAGGRKGEVVRWLVANHHSGGTMTYGDSSHIHVDIGPHFVSLAGGAHYASASRGRSRGGAERTANSDGGARRTAQRQDFAGYMGLGSSPKTDGR